MGLGSYLNSLPKLLLYCLCLVCVNATIYREFLRMGQSIGVSDTIVSSHGSYELGFFTRIRENSTKYYVGIWFKKVPHDKILWVANRDYALKSSSAALTIHSNGNIVIIDGSITYRVTSVPDHYGTHAMLLDSGNFALLSSSQAILWQSFDTVTDTLLAGMQLGNTWSLRSWTSADDPTAGPFSLKYDYGMARLIVSNDSNVLWIDGSSNVSVQAVIDRMGMRWMEYSTLPFDNNSRLILEVSGDLNHQHWSEKAMHWVSLQSAKCGTNNSCGFFSICNPQALDPCGCLNGFQLSDADSRRQGNKSAGCIRSKELSCSNRSSNNNDRFLKFSKVELPPNEIKMKINMAAKCQSTCINNCSCIAYAYDFKGNCMLWLDQVSSLKNVSTDTDIGNKNYPSFYLRLAASEFFVNGSNITDAFGRRGNKNKNLLVIVIPISLLIMLILLGLFVYWTRRLQRKKEFLGEDLLRFEVSTKVNGSDEDDNGTKDSKEEVKLPIFSFVSVAASTENFSDANLLGRGGFGPVYKGTLIDGQEVAIKRNTEKSDQGLVEFENEAILIARLQHRNLVKLLGCCIHGEEKMLIYEYMPNKSLDYFIFNESQSRLLDWLQRFGIIDGVARGILYLHQDSRLRVIHRDLKPSNVLLDSMMKAKISDFGLARTCSGDEVEAYTKNLAGTYGKKSSGFSDPEKHLELLGHAWRLWTEDRALELIEEHLRQSCNLSEIKRCIHVGLLCVQQKPDDRPDASSVVLMLNGDKLLQQPKPPGFYTRDDLESSTRIHNLVSQNEMSLTIFEPR